MKKNFIGGRKMHLYLSNFNCTFINQGENRRDLLILYCKKLIMNGIIISTDKKEEIKLFAQLAKQLGIKSKVLTDEEMLDLGLLNAMNEGRKSGYVSKEEIERKLNRT